jgi:SAM-dependent methyltransferase
MSDFAYLEAVRTDEVDRVAPTMPANARLLDFGAGLGFQARRFKELGFDVSAVDVSRARPAGNVFPVAVYDGHTLPYPDAHFDVVFSSNVLEHVADLGSTMRELGRVLRGGGVMVHVLPSSTWRWWTTVVEFVALPRDVVRPFIDPDPDFRFANLPGPLSSLMEAVWHLVRPVLFIRHGEKGNAVTELWRFSRWAWARTFAREGFEVKQAASVGLWYTGAMLLGSKLSFGVRRRLATCLGSSTIVWYLRPRQPASG